MAKLVKRLELPKPPRSTYDISTFTGYPLGYVRYHSRELGWQVYRWTKTGESHYVGTTQTRREAVAWLEQRHREFPS